MLPRLREKFEFEVTKELATEFSIANTMALPRVDKIVISVGLGKQLEGTKINPKAREQVIKDLTVISGQRPVMTKAKKSVSNFKLRAGYEIGSMVTMRGNRMWEFFDRLVSLAIPRIKDFRGLSKKGFDHKGNYSFGITEQGVFPEVDIANAVYTHGMNITIVMSNSSPEISKKLLASLGVPFAKPDSQKRN